MYFHRINEKGISFNTEEKEIEPDRTSTGGNSGSLLATEGNFGRRQPQGTNSKHTTKEREDPKISKMTSRSRYKISKNIDVPTTDRVVRFINDLIICLFLVIYIFHSCTSKTSSNFTSPFFPQKEKFFHKVFAKYFLGGNFFYIYKFY